MLKVSTRKNRKYMVTRGGKTIHFGDKRYYQYRDSTPLKAYSHLAHLDKKRQTNYKLRHEKTRHNKYSASWYADKYLWS